MLREQKGFGTLGIVLVILVLGIVGFSGWFLLKKDKKESASTTTGQNTATTIQVSETEFGTPKKGAHFESSTPAHASTLAAVPAVVVIDFNFDLANNSTLEITKDGKDWGSGEVSFDSSKLAMRRKMDLSAPDGVYTVKYSGCWPDRTCHYGHFQFAIDRTLIGSYDDKRSQKNVTIRMSDIEFVPMNMRVSVGTTITWVNDDAVEHYVNTDSHPAHTHAPGLNSKALANGQSFAFTFTEKGVYPYHCSAHAADMIGAVVVE